MKPPSLPPVKRRWLVLATVAGLAAAAAVGVWAGGPHWHSAAFGPGFDLGFSPDGGELLTSHGLEPGPDGRFDPRIIRWDAVTGRPLGATPLVWEGPPIVTPPGVPNRLYVTHVPGGQRLLVGSIVPGTEPCVEYYVHDAATGRKTAGPFRSYGFVTTCSPDGRWCAAGRGATNGLAVISTATGETVLDLRPGSDSFTQCAAFSPDGNRVAVLWLPDQTAGQHFVQLYDLPSGRKGRRLDLPLRPWQWIKEWSADRLYIEVRETDSHVPLAISWRVWSFSLANDNFGAAHIETLLTRQSATDAEYTFWETGLGWMAYIDRVTTELPQWRRWLERTGRKVGLSLGRSPHVAYRVRFLDPDTGAVKTELPRVGHPWAIAPNGRWVATIHPERSVEVWAVGGVPPWVWAAAAGAICGGGVLGLAACARGRPAKPAVEPPNLK
jgi:hypothetical protein